MRLGIILDKAFTEHKVPSGHPERPERIEELLERSASWSSDPGVVRISPQRCGEAEISRVHTQAHYARIRATSGVELSELDFDTQTGPASFETALLAAGSGTHLVDKLYLGEIDAGVLLARPPGHHAERNRAMGFCLFNNIAVAAQHAVSRGLAKRVAIVDFDVHHGNGTQEIFYSRSDVLYISSHQFPLYPGTGRIEEVGEGDGRGYTLNLPLRAGTGDSFFDGLYARCVVPVLEEFQPDLILVSAGYDAHYSDPLAGLELTARCYRDVSARLTSVARAVAGGRILFFLEGGYNLNALGACVSATIDACLGDFAGDDTARTEVPPASSKVSGLDEYLAEASRHFGPYWTW